MQAQIATNQAKVWALPKSAVVQMEGKHWIFLRMQGGAERKEVQLGKQDGDWLEILGFNGDREVALEGAYYLVKAEGGDAH